jgi:carbamoyltransferase
VFVDHHLSHAALAFHSSPYEHALIFVIDAGGNVLDKVGATNKWWLHSRQQFSVYEGRGNKIDLVGQHFSGPGEVGLGEMFRAFTHYLGWNSGSQAGKLMALSGATDRQFDDSHLFFEAIEGDLKLKPNLEFHPSQTLELARTLLGSVGLKHLGDIWETSESFEARAEIAGLVQFNLEGCLEHCFRYWSKKLGLKKMCFAGGVALNCTAVRRLREKCAAEVFVPPGAGDNGQCVGNAILGNLQFRGKVPDLSELVFRGVEYKITEASIRATLAEIGCDARVVRYADDKSYFRSVVDRLHREGVIVWFQGEAEFGARALGNRCLLGNPNELAVKQILNRVKRRETFNPFAASCIYEDSHDYFESSRPSEYMTETFRVKSSSLGHLLKAVVHDDGTCRAQIFKREFNPRYHDLISTYKEQYGVAALLNTSLNGSQEPIVENVKEAIALFSKNEVIRTAVIGDYIVTKPQGKFGYF